MSELTDLYQEVILDHNRKPRNFRVIDPATASQEGYNPLCGDRLKLFLKVETASSPTSRSRAPVAPSPRPRRR